MSSVVLQDHDGQENNYKNVLNSLLQRISGQSMTKEHIEFSVERHGKEFQSTVTLTCMDGNQINGELKENAKEAEQSAAHQALLSLEQDLGAMGFSLDPNPLSIPKSVTEAAIEGGVADDADGVQEALGEKAVKSMLHAVLSAVLDRALEKGDIEYRWVDAPKKTGQYVAKLKMAALPGALGKKEWSGAVSAFKRDSQLDCALKAMDAILSDKDTGALDLKGKIRITSNKEKKLAEKASKAEKREKLGESSAPRGTGGKGANKKKGAGKGNSSKGYGKWDMASQMSMMAQDPMMQQMVMMQMMGMPMGKMMGKGWGAKGGGKGSKATGGPRKRISEDAITGDVVEWKGKFGFIEPHMPVDHPSAAKNGRIYVNKKDVEGDIEQGQGVTFFVYKDNSGLGAEGVAAM